jgi:hypothetical protein
LSPAAEFAKLSHIDAERHQADLVLATERRGHVRGIGVFATFMIPGEGANVQGHVDEEGSEEAEEEALAAT